MADNEQPLAGAPLSPPAGEIPAAGAAPLNPSGPAPAPDLASQAEAPTSAPSAAEAPDPALASPPSLLEEFDKGRAETKPPEPAKPADAAAPAEGDKKPEVEAKPEAAKTDEKKPEDVPAEAAKPDAAADAKPAAPAVPAPLEYKYELPPILKMDDTLKTELHSALDAYRADPVNVQPLIDLHTKAIQDFAAETRREQYRIFNETRAGWRKEVMADEQIGGAGHQTAMGAIARMRDLAVPEADRPAFDEFLKVTGAGDHPAFLRAMHNFARYFDEPAPPPPNPKPSPTNGAKPGKGGVRDLYTHPTSRDQRP